MSLKTLGAHLQRARLRYAASREDLAETLGTSARHLGAVEAGAISPSAPILKAYAERFRMNFAELDRLRR